MSQVLLMDALRRRRSIRRFTDRPIAREMLAQLIDAARCAPSAGNRQDWLFIAVLSQSTKEQMAKAVNRKWAEILQNNRDSGASEEVESYAANFSTFSTAPAVIAVACRSANALQRQLLKEDAEFVTGAHASAAMAAQNLMLAAHAAGLGSCCMTGPLAAEADLLPLLGLGKKHRIVCLLALGHPAESPAEPARKPVQDIFRIIE